MVPPALTRRKLPPPEMTPENVCVPVELPPCSSFDLTCVPTLTGSGNDNRQAEVQTAAGKRRLERIRGVGVWVPTFILAIVSEPLVPTMLLLSNSITTLADRAGAEEGNRGVAVHIDRVFDGHGAVVGRGKYAAFQIHRADGRLGIVAERRSRTHQQHPVLDRRRAL